MRRAIATACLVLLPVFAHAVERADFDAKTAGQLASLCGAKRGEPRAIAALNFCDGFAQAALDMKLTGDRTAGRKEICIPNPAPKRRTTLEEFVTWVRAQPDRLGAPSIEAFLRFMSERFPCKPG